MLLALSPHLDDAVFSIGGLLSHLAAAGEKVTVATVFTATVVDPRGFALACQTDKGFGPEVDYMALRRAEDEVACGLLGVALEHWGFAEAPHRGYSRAAQLFDGIRDAKSERKLIEELAARITAAIETHDPAYVCYPVGAGNHVDHLVLIESVSLVRERYPNVRWLQWYDQPYVARHPVAYEHLAFAKTVGALAAIGEGVEAFEWRAGIRPGAAEVPLLAKWEACAAYASQVGYQFYEALGEQRAPDAVDETRIAAVIGPREWLQAVISRPLPRTPSSILR